MELCCADIFIEKPPTFIMELLLTNCNHDIVTEMWHIHFTFYYSVNVKRVIKSSNFCVILVCVVFCKILIVYM